MVSFYDNMVCSIYGCIGDSNMAFVTLGLIGPVFSTAETYVLNFAGWIITVGYGIGAMVMGQCIH